jgi:hypothetical protein
MERLETISIRGAESLTRKTKYNDKGEAEVIELCLKYELLISQAEMSLTLVLDRPSYNAIIIRSWNKTGFVIVGGMQTLARAEGNEQVKILLPKEYFNKCFEDAKIVRTVSEFKELLKRVGYKTE